MILSRFVLKTVWGHCIIEVYSHSVVVGESLLLKDYSVGPNLQLRIYFAYKYGELF